MMPLINTLSELTGQNTKGALWIKATGLVFVILKLFPLPLLTSKRNISDERLNAGLQLNTYYNHTNAISSAAPGRARWR